MTQAGVGYGGRRGRPSLPEVGAVCLSGHVRICAGGAGQPASLPRRHLLSSVKRWTQGQWPKGCQSLTPDEEQEIEKIRLAFFRGDWTALERWGGAQSALFYQRDLKRRPLEGSECGFRIDRADAWRSQRLSISSGATLK